MWGCRASSCTLIASNRIFKNLTGPFNWVAWPSLCSLINRLEHTSDAQVILELDGYRLVCQRLEHRENELFVTSVSHPSLL
jgi:hypothetical protein